ncbi:Acylpeptide hydrolase [Mycena chlorophos]|uniref:Required for respiratory growth protein 9, mitochondrial n=1 Tax=Mycena chlorophos TaxID=658473 RepID=A0A8H6TKP6_MYCCL|nr:Acylpeptide hydrolase [Mycena chlorophos]
MLSFSFRGLVVALGRRRVSSNAAARSAQSILSDDSAPVDLSEDNDAVDGRRQPRPTGPPTEPTPAAWQTHRSSLKAAFPDGWNPPKKLSREAMDGLRQLHRMNPETFSTPVLAERFRISPEAVRRILKSRWEPSTERRMRMVKKEAEIRLERRQGRREREQTELEEVLRSKRDMRAAKLRNSGQQGDRFTFE